MNIKPNYEIAQDTAIAVLKTIGYYKLPIDPLEIAKYCLNLKVKTYRDISIITNYSTDTIAQVLNTDDGELIYNPNNEKNVLIYNEAVPNKNRQRFTQAHELGHFFLNHNKKNKNCSIFQGNLTEEEYDVMEKEANYFAKRLLAPIPLITATIRNISDGKLYTSELANEFSISEQTADYVIDNMQKLSYWPRDKELELQFHDALNEQIKAINSTRDLPDDIAILF